MSVCEFGIVLENLHQLWRLSVIDSNSRCVTCILTVNQVDQLLHLVLRPEEVEHIVSYLKSINTPLSQDILLLHYLQQSRFVDAIQLDYSSSTAVSIISLFVC